MASTLRKLAFRKLLGSRPMSGGGSASAGDHAEAAEKLWKNLTLFVGLPTVVLASYLIIKKDLEEHPEPPEFKPYDHMRIRKKNFPWGDGKKSFFHNPDVNPLPTGYEPGHGPGHHH